MLPNLVWNRSALVCAATITLLSCAGRTGTKTVGRVAELGNEGVRPSSGTIIDTHTHFFDPARSPPPGRGTPVPWPVPGKALYRTVLPSEYAKLGQPLGITGTVVVEASPWLEDNDWILELARKEKVIVGLVGNLREVWSDPVKYRAAVERYARNPLFRGIRVGQSQVKSAGVPGPDRDNFKVLAASDLVADVRAEWAHVDALAAAVPDLRIVVEHMGFGFKVRTPADPEWAAGVALVARRPNVFMKVSAMVELADAPDGQPPLGLDAYQASLDVLWQAFGEDRLVYGTNWPVSDRASSLAAVHAIASAYFAGKSASARAKFFAGNARAIYKWVRRDWPFNPLIQPVRPTRHGLLLRDKRASGGPASWVFGFGLGRVQESPDAHVKAALHELDQLVEL